MGFNVIALAFKDKYINKRIKERDLAVLLLLTLFVSLASVGTLGGTMGESSMFPNLDKQRSEIVNCGSRTGAELVLKEARTKELNPL